MSHRLKVAYILSRFPRLTETFILREMLDVRELGLELHIFSMLPPLPTPVHDRAIEMMPFVRYSPFLFSGPLLLAQLYFLFRSPLRYVRALAGAIWQTYREAKVMLLALSMFPKSVYFARQMQQLNIDHIHAHFIWVTGIAAKIVSDLTGITFSLHAHAFDIFMRDQENVRRQVELAHGVIANTDYNRRYIANLCGWPPEKVGLVYNGLDLSEFTPEHIPAENGRVRIISVGSLYEKKGYEYLIEACAQLAQKRYSFQCNIVGHGYLREALQARIDEYGLQNCVSLLGPKKQAEVQDLYRRSDIFVLACIVGRDGDRDGLPNVLLEAMAMQLPVVTTPVSAIPEVVHDGKTGLLTPERDVEALTLALERLIRDKNLRCTLGQQARKVILDGFDIRRAAAQLADAFQDIRGSNIAEKA